VPSDLVSLPRSLNGDRTAGTLSFAWVAAVVCLLCIISFPALPEGYGSDADAWLVARTSTKLWETGQYSPSRLPGYPLHEIASAPLVALGGCFASNAGTLVFALLLVAVWFRMARTHASHPRIAFLLLPLTPLVIVNGAVTLDYLWSLPFVVLALDFTLRRRHVAAAIALGMAAGFRLSNLSAAIPLFVMLHASGTSAADLRRFIGILAAIVVIAYMPLLLTFGPIGWIVNTRSEMRDVLDMQLAQRGEMFLYRAVYALGPAATITAGWILFASRKSLTEEVRHRDPLVAGTLTALVVFLVQFLCLPLERAYLLPVLPFLYLLLDRHMSDRSGMILLVCVIVLNVVNVDIVRHGREGPHFAPDIYPGRIAESWTERREFKAAMELNPIH
jgi:hypothetical protein